MDGIDDLEVGKISAGHYLVEGFFVDDTVSRRVRVGRGRGRSGKSRVVVLGRWRVRHHDGTAAFPHGFKSLVAAKRAIVDLLNGVQS